MIHDQAALLRELVQSMRLRTSRRAGSPQLIVIAGGVPGVGTTTVAIHLATALAARSGRVLLIDADLDSAGATGLFGLSPEQTLLDVLSRRSTLADAIIHLPGALRIVAGLWGSRLLLDDQPADAVRLIDDLHGFVDCDQVILDVGCGRGAIEREIWNAADRLMLVMTEENAALMGAYASIKVNGRRQAASTELIINRCQSQEAAQQAAERIAASAERFLSLRTSLLAWLPPDSALAAHLPGTLAQGLAATGFASHRTIIDLAEQLLQIGSTTQTGESLPPTTAAA